MLDRRTFLKSLTAVGATMALPLLGVSPTLGADSPAAPGSLDFAFFTDTHIEPELDAAHGCEMCFRKIAASHAEFAIMGGDHVYDALGVNGTRASSIFDLYKRTEQTLSMPLHNTIGNHDVFGLLTKSGVAPTDPAYGKKMYQDRMGRTFYSFERKGYHFVVLDSIQPTPDRMWEARVDVEQLQWLRAVTGARAGDRGDALSAGDGIPQLRARGHHGAQVQHVERGQLLGGAGNLRASQRAGGTAGAHAYQRSREL